jgi:glycosyltransferase involved in cell wall biosynthesis
MKLSKIHIKYIIGIIILTIILYIINRLLNINKESFDNIPLVTFIIPTIGRDTLNRTIESIKNQTRTNWKAIIIFDGIKPTIDEKDKRIKVIQIDKKGRLNYAGRVRNSGIEKVDTEWVAFVDDDDTLTKNYLEVFENEIEDSLDVLIFRMLKGNQVLPPYEHTDFVKNYVGISFTAKTNLFKNENIWFNESPTEDYDILDKFRSNNKNIKISNEVTYIVR